LQSGLEDARVRPAPAPVEVVAADEAAAEEGDFGWEPVDVSADDDEVPEMPVWLAVTFFAGLGWQEARDSSSG